jgi:hypothetical protein
MAEIPAPQPGLVIRHDFLWCQDAAAKRDQGKDRPACVIIVIDVPNAPTFTVILPITHSRPAKAEDGVEIPEATRQRLGLDDSPCWVIVSEYNIDQWPPPGLSLVPRQNAFSYGFLPPKLFADVMATFTTAYTAGQTAKIDRTKP